MSKMRVALYGLEASEALKEFMPELLRRFREKKIEFQVEKKFYEILNRIPDVDLENIPTYKSHEDLWKDLDLFFTFGGDGTILAGITIVQNSNIPMVGVNTGRLGYLAGINKKEILEHLDDILNKNFRISSRSLVNIHSPGLNLKFPFALNEVTVMRKETTSMITIDAYIEDQLINSFWCDGLIISTPTGSTGYSLSCNGPIISPETNNLVITPIAPHNLNVRPIVLPDNVEISLTVHSRVPEFSLSLDARLDSIDVKHKICVQKADFKVHIVQLKHSNYLETLRQKLFWGIDRRN